MQCPLGCGGDDTVESTGTEAEFRCTYCGYSFETADGDILTDLFDALEDVVNGDGLACWDDVEAFADDAAIEISMEVADGADA